MAIRRQVFRVRVGERDHEVEVEVDEAATGAVPQIRVDGRGYEAAPVGGHAMRVSCTDSGAAQQLEVTLAGEPRATEAWARGARVHVELQTEAEARLAAALGDSAGASASGSLTAPMPGRVVAINVVEGAEVQQGSPALIVEAMKMENEIYAPITGVVRRVCVAVGDTVDAGQVLCEFDAAADPQES